MARVPTMAAGDIMDIDRTDRAIVSDNIYTPTRGLQRLAQEIKTLARGIPPRHLRVSLNNSGLLKHRGQTDIYRHIDRSWHMK